VVLRLWLVWMMMVSTAFGFEQHTLKNGLELVSFHSDKVPLVTIVLTFKAGGMTETEELDGLTHLWEHMFFKGNKRLPNQEAFIRRIRQLGIVFNGDTSAEKVRYYFTLPSNFLEEGIQFMADAIRTPLLDKKELEKEIKVVLDEYDRSASGSGFRLHKLTQRLIYGTESHRRDPLGLKRTTLANTTQKQLLRIRDEVFVPQNGALVVGGDFKQAELVKLVEKYFGDWRSPKDWKAPVHPAFQAFPNTQTVVATHPDAQNARLTLTYLGPTVEKDPKDTFIADVLISLLQSRNGKFYKKFIDSGRAYQSGLSYYTQSKAGELDIYVSCDPDKVQALRSDILKEVKLWMGKGYFSQAELDDVRTSLGVQYLRETNSPSSYTKTLAFWWPVTGLEYYRGYLDGMRAVSIDDIRGFVKKYLEDKNHIDQILVAPDAIKALGLSENLEALIQQQKLVF
jgi:zinc protease